jgi:hypothetical protein
MSTTTVAILLAAGNPACLFLGFLFGRLTRATIAIEEKIVDEKKIDTDSVRRHRSIAKYWVMVIVAAIGLITAVVGFMVTRNQDRLTGCVVGYSNALADAFEQRLAASNDVNEQLDNVMSSFLAAFNDAPEVGRDRVFKAIEEYNKARTEAKNAQRENPLPDAPRDACAELLD